MSYFVKAAWADIYAAGGDPYYGGDRIDPADVEVQPRPDATQVWNGTEWVQDPVLAAAAAKDKLSANLVPSDPQGIRLAEELFAALKAKGILADADVNATALANVNVRRAIRGQGPL